MLLSPERASCRQETFIYLKNSSHTNETRLVLIRKSTGKLKALKNRVDIKASKSMVLPGDPSDWLKYT